MSGGVDSTVAAARLLDEGHEVSGAYFSLMGDPRLSGHGTVRDGSGDARRVADALGVALDVWDLSTRFAHEVVDDFVNEYAAGRTPNPCLRCNQTIKFGAVVERALSLGFDAVATGHYARVETVDGRARLCRASALAKDQSYVLGVLNQEQLRHVRFPLGDVASKAEVREEASRRGLFVAGKPDSTDICFIPDGDTGGFLRDVLGERPGEIVDDHGTVLGTHRGLYRFTIGQRHGLRLTVPAAGGEPRYVVRLEADTNRVVVGPRSRLAVRAMWGVGPTWTDEPVAGPWRGLAQWRAHQQPVPATFEVRPRSSGQMNEVDELWATFDGPVFGVAPGQRLVCYDGDRVVGSVVIVRGEA